MKIGPVELQIRQLRERRAAEAELTTKAHRAATREATNMAKKSKKAKATAPKAKKRSVKEAAANLRKAKAAKKKPAAKDTDGPPRIIGKTPATARIVGSIENHPRVRGKNPTAVQAAAVAAAIGHAPSNAPAQRKASAKTTKDTGTGRTKIADLELMLRNGGGVTIDEVCAATGWIPKSARAAISGINLRGGPEKAGIPVKTTKNAEGKTVYRI